MSKPRILLLSDAVSHTGFARVSHSLLAHLRHNWDVSVLGINYRGDPHSYPYPIYPARNGGDIWGVGRYQELVKKVQPDLVFIIQDPWNVVEYTALKGDEKIVAYMAVDAPCLPRLSGLNDLDLAIWYTDFGQREGEKAGYNGESIVIPHGVNTDVYRPLDRLECRRALKLDFPDDAFIVGNVGRNQSRKRLDLTVKYFARWVQRERLPANVYLWIHAARTDMGCDFVRLADYWGVADRLICSSDVKPGCGVTEQDLVRVYNAFDVQINTSIGEGWGLPTMEGMACGVPQVAGDWSGLGEWAKGAAVLVPCSTIQANPNPISTVGGVPDEEPFVDALHALYTDRRYCGEVADRGFDLVKQDRFRWETIAGQFHDAFLDVLNCGKAEANGVACLV